MISHAGSARAGARRRYGRELPMTLMRWPDGGSVETDPRRDDPIYYYVKKNDWASSVGFEVTPVNEESRVSSVEISVFAPHRVRLSNHNHVDRAEMYARTIAALVKRFKNWTRITIHDDTAGSLEANLATAFELIGWDVRVDSPSDLTLTRRESIRPS